MEIDLLISFMKIKHANIYRMLIIIFVEIIWKIAKTIKTIKTNSEVNIQKYWIRFIYYVMQFKFMLGKTNINKNIVLFYYH